MTHEAPHVTNYNGAKQGGARPFRRIVTNRKLNFLVLSRFHLFLFTIQAMFVARWKLICRNSIFILYYNCGPIHLSSLSCTSL